MEDRELNSALAVAGLGITGVFIQAPRADTGGCDGERQRHHQVDWISIIIAATILAILSILILGSDGAAGPVLAPAVKRAFQYLLVALITPILPAMAGTSNSCPTWYVGTIGQGGLPMDQFTSHVAFATSTKSPKDLIYDGVEKSRGWTAKTVECNQNSLDQLPLGPGFYHCDEYPFNKTMQGGAFGYPEVVSLRLIEANHNLRGGGAFGAFLYKCEVSTMSRIRVETTSGASRFERSSGVPCTR